MEVSFVLFLARIIWVGSPSVADMTYCLLNIHFPLPPSYSFSECRTLILLQEILSNGSTPGMACSSPALAYDWSRGGHVTQFCQWDVSRHLLGGASGEVAAFLIKACLLWLFAPLLLLSSFLLFPTYNTNMIEVCPGCHRSRESKAWGFLGKLGRGFLEKVMLSRALTDT